MYLIIVSREPKDNKEFTKTLIAVKIYYHGKYKKFLYKG
jgi:hypothetical protein